MWPWKMIARGKDFEKYKTLYYTVEMSQLDTLGRDQPDSIGFKIIIVICIVQWQNSEH